MKSFFSIILICLSLKAVARDIVFISYDTKSDILEHIISTIEQEHSIPRSLITTRQSKSGCGTSLDPIVHLCIQNRKMTVVEINQKVILNSFAGLKERNDRPRRTKSQH